MKRYRDRTGTECVWYNPGEIEMIMENELTKAKLFPTLDAPVVDIETFIEGYLKARIDQYAELDARVLGVTEFRAGQPPFVQVNKDLTGSALDEAGSPAFLLGRWRATLAHEGSHIVLHQCLFQVNPNQGGLFDGPDDNAPQPVDPVHRCFKKNVAFGGGAKDSREVQANMGMAALLMPSSVFREAVRNELHDAGWSQVRLVRNSRQAFAIVGQLATVFQVSRQAASIRLESLGLLADPTQAELD